jgi:hypothetical protein
LEGLDVGLLQASDLFVSSLFAGSTREKTYKSRSLEEVEAELDDNIVLISQNLGYPIGNPSIEA